MSGEIVIMKKSSSPSSIELNNQCALIEVALQMVYCDLSKAFDQVYSNLEMNHQATASEIQAQKKEIEQAIQRMREEADKIAAVAQKMENLLPKIMDAMRSDAGADCPDSDPRKVEFFRLWNQPQINPSEWQRLANRFSKAEKTAFARRLAHRAHHTGLHGFRIMELQLRPDYILRLRKG